MDYIEKLLGEKVTAQPWGHEQELPMFLPERYEIQKVNIGKTAVLLLHVKGELEQIPAVKKHIARICKVDPIPAALVLTAATRYQRNALIEAKIPFVIPEKQLYLPFLGIALQERFDAVATETEQLPPAAQVLLLFFLYRKQKALPLQEAVKALGYSAMTITRAARQLVQTGSFREEKQGVQKVLVTDWKPKALFQALRPRLSSPVRKRGYLPIWDVTPQYLTAGETALSEWTMLNAPGVHCYAVDGKGKSALMNYLIDPQKYAAIEYWKYDPCILGRNGTVDPLSLSLSMEHTEDERVEEAVQELLDALWEEDYGKGN